MVSLSEIQQQASTGSPTDIVRVGGSTFTKQQIRDAVTFGSRVARGKGTSGFAGKSSFDRLRSVLPEFRREIQKGTAARLGKFTPVQKEQFAEVKIRAIESERQASLLPETRQAVRQQVKSAFLPTSPPSIEQQVQVSALPSVVQPVQEREGLIGGLESFKRETQTKGLRGEISPFQRAGLLGASLALSIARVPERTLGFGKSLIFEPVQTIKGIPSSFVQAGKGIGTELRGPTPETALGSIAAEVLIFKGLGAAPGLVTKGADVFRTRGLTELPLTQVVAPEFLKGQTFPAIRKGQTAGELLGEFSPRLPGETRPAGFTAAARPFESATITGRGTSEFPGVFQAPLVSPRFLRVGGEAERKLFSFNVFDTFRPSIVRITPERIGLAPGVSPRQTQLATDIRGTRAFFETAPKGESFIPFIKTEKEAVIPFGTRLQLVDKRFFVKFEGRRVPIFEFKTAGAGADVATFRSSLPSIEDITSNLSRGRIRQRGVITPSSSLGFVPSGISFRPIVSRSVAGRPSGRRSRASRGISSRGLVDPSFLPRSSAGSRGFDSPSGLEAPGFSVPVFQFEPSVPTPRRARRKTTDKKRKKKGAKPRRKVRVPIRPSFTGIVLEIEEAAVVSPTLGVTPGQIRGLATGFDVPARRTRKRSSS